MSTQAVPAPRRQPLPVLRIEPSRGWVSLQLRDLWEHHELLYFLTWRDVKVRYKQTSLGVLWAVLQPLLMMLVFSLFFGRLGKIPSDGVPYPVFSLTGLIPWSFFAQSLTQSSNSLVASANMIKKVYFPRLVIPISSVLAAGVDLMIGLGILGCMMAYHRVPITARMLCLPLLLLLAVVTSLGAGLWLSALNVKYRDVRFLVPFLVQFWMYATPIAYPSSMLSEPWRTVFALNPMVGVVEGFRWALLGTNTASSGPMLWVSAGAAVLLMTGGAFYFRRMERTFADVV